MKIEIEKLDNGFVVTRIYDWGDHSKCRRVARNFPEVVRELTKISFGSLAVPDLIDLLSEAMGGSAWDGTWERSAVEDLRRKLLRNPS